MIDEHFGIALVEMMAAGIIVVAHKSGKKEESNGLCQSLFMRTKLI